MLMIYTLPFHCCIFPLSCNYWADCALIWTLVYPVTLTVCLDSCPDCQRSFLELFSGSYLCFFSCWGFFSLWLSTQKQRNGISCCLPTVNLQLLRFQNNTYTVCISRFLIKQPKSFALIFIPTLLKIVLYSFSLKENLSVVEIFLLLQCFYSALGCLSKGIKQGSRSKAMEKTKQLWPWPDSLQWGAAIF